MQWILSLVLGLVFAWSILFFIGPRRSVTVSYYVQAPVQPTDLDKIMEAVGLEPSRRAPPARVDEMMGCPPAPAPVQSVADISVTQQQQSEVHVDQGMSSTPQPAAPAPAPGPAAPLHM